MKTKEDHILSRDVLPISLKVLLEKQISSANKLAKGGFSDIDQSIHEIRKSLKAILAILILYKDQLQPLQYLKWRRHIQALLKQYAIIREPYVSLQTFNNVEKKLKELDEKYCIELRNYQESKYRSSVKENYRLEEILRQLNGSFVEISKAIKKASINTDIKSLKKGQRKTFQKSKNLVKDLTLASSSIDFHRFRKWSRYYYFQQSILSDLGLQKTSSKEINKLHKLIEYLGNEHDLQLFYQGLKMNFTDLSDMAKPFFEMKIKKLRKKALSLSSQIYS